VRVETPSDSVVRVAEDVVVFTEGVMMRGWAARQWARIDDIDYHYPRSLTTGVLEFARICIVAS
jgi:hypothetical protein